MPSCVTMIFMSNDDEGRECAERLRKTNANVEFIQIKGDESKSIAGIIDELENSEQIEINMKVI